jgi:hypothetical protein
MEMETEDDMALEGSVDVPSSSSVVALVVSQEVQPDIGEQVLVRNEELGASLESYS